MKKLSHLKRYAGLAFCCLLFIGFGNSSSAQTFISREDRPRWGFIYENYGDYDYRLPRNYKDNLLRRFDKSSTDREWVNPAWHGPANPVTYDQFGNFLLPGGDIYNLTWDKSTVGASQVYGDNAASIFNNLMISSDEFSNWQTQFMVGTNLRVYFTPSTLKRTNFNGIRWDASSRKNSFTFVASVGSNPSNARLDAPPTESDYRNLFGAYWQSVLGDVLKIGGSFVTNQRGTQSYSNRDIDSGITGIKEVDFPRYMYVVVTDGTPEDTRQGARVYQIKAILDGKESNLPNRVFKIQNFINQITFQDGKFNIQNQVLVRADGTSSFIPEAIENFEFSTGSWFYKIMKSSTYNSNDAIYRQLFTKGAGKNKTDVLGYVNVWNFDNPSDNSGRYYSTDTNKGYVDAYGTDVIIYEYEIPAGVRSVDFALNIANSYCIDIIAAMPSRQQAGMGDWNDAGYGESWGGSNWSPKYDIKHCKKSKGNVSDFSNTSWVKVSYDRLTGVNVYGLNMDFNWRGLSIKGEINEYNALWAYPVHEYLKGGNTNITSARAWFINIEKDFKIGSLGGELFNYPKEYMEYWAPIDDNDDNNRNVGLSEYPGLNVDWDRSADGHFIDSTWNGEPYIEYYFDGLSYGDDFNHNGIIDERENDYSADLPYDRDSKGQHYFVKLKPRDLSMLSLGYYDIKQDYQEGRNKTEYAKFEHTQKLGSFFEYGIFHRTERIQDDYRSDKTYSQYWGPSGRFNNRAFRDAWYNTSFVKTTFTPIPNFNIINNFKYDSINRVGDLTIDGSDVERTMRAPRDIASFSTVHKADYTFRVADLRVIPDLYIGDTRIFKEKKIKEFKFQPQFKLEQSYSTANLFWSTKSGHYYRYYPVLRFDYRVAPKTLLRCAIQGLPGLMDISRNSANSINDQNVRKMFLGFETTTLYQGFNLLVTSGMRRTKQQWVKSYGRTETGYTQYFIELRCEASR